MIGTFTPEQEDFRAQVCALLCGPAVRDEVAGALRLPATEEPGLLEVYRRLGDRGWLAVNWPKQYGGLGGSLVEKAIVTEELITHGIPDVVSTLSIDIVGLALLRHGTERQKRRLLPPLASGRSAATILFSEPDIGSDLSALATRAEPDGDGWRLYGRKIYSMKTHVADIALCAARTSASSVKYHGITLFLLPLQNFGVLVEPLWNITNDRFLDVTLDGIRVTADDVLGDVDDGWHTINQVLSLERTGLDSVARATRLLDALLRYAAETGRLDDPGYTQRLVDIESRVRAARLLSWRCVTDLRDNTPDELHTATAKWYGTEVTKELAGLALEVVGLDGTLHASDVRAAADGLFEAAYREVPGLTLAAGTSEIMLYMIAGKLD
ncbi:MAG: acyl-CoA dehydrogenase family protein, partial [Micromonosporaceae bacterium]